LREKARIEYMPINDIKVPSPLAGEGQGEGGVIQPGFLASQRFAIG